MDPNTMQQLDPSIAKAFSSKFKQPTAEEVQNSIVNKVTSLATARVALHFEIAAQAVKELNASAEVQAYMNALASLSYMAITDEVGKQLFEASKAAINKDHVTQMMKTAIMYALRVKQDEVQTSDSEVNVDFVPHDSDSDMA